MHKQCMGGKVKLYDLKERDRERERERKRAEAKRRHESKQILKVETCLF